MANPDHSAILNQGVEAWNQWRKDNPDEVSDLSGANLNDMDLSEADLRGANLEGVELEEADLSRAKLEGAKLNKAKLFKARLNGARLKRAELREADLSWADFRGARLARADLSGAKVDCVLFDNEMKCRGINVTGCTGSQRFVRHVMDLDYLHEFGASHPWAYKLWKISSDCGRSWARFSYCCMIIIMVFGAVLLLFDNVEHPFFTSVFAFSSFGFIDSTNRDFWELFVLALESLVGFAMFGCLVSLIATKMARRSG